MLLCVRGANREKLNRSPAEAFQSRPEWADIRARAAKLPDNTHWRFNDDAMAERESGFLDRQMAETRYLARTVKSGDPENLEAQAARRYWQNLFGRDFRRDPGQPGINGLLNYGYAILRGGVARAVWALVQQGQDHVTPTTKRHLASLLTWDLDSPDGVTPVASAMQDLVTSLAQLYLGERRAYRQFRDFLLDEGLCMTQFSIYMRVQAGKERVEALCKRIRRNLPADGRVSILQITDRHYENIISFIGRVPGRAAEKPEQYLLFCSDLI